MDDLEADWKAVRRPKRPKRKDTPFDLHEDWIAVKGGKYPPFAFIIRWRDPRQMAVFRMAITGKRRVDGGTFYQVVYHSLVFKTPGTRLYKSEVPDDTHYERCQLCFSRAEVEREIQDYRMQHISTIQIEVKRLAYLAEDVMNKLKGFDEFIANVRSDPIPLNVLRKIPSKPSKKLVIP